MVELPPGIIFDPETFTGDTGGVLGGGGDTGATYGGVGGAT